MKSRLWIGALLGGLLSTAALADPPRVVKCSPDNGAIDVDPASSELRVTFDQPMRGGFSFVSDGRSFPGSGARPHWIDSKTCSLPISLKANREYMLGINSNSFQNFRSVNDEAATPYVIHFYTAQPETAQANDAAIAKLRDAIDKDYSYLDVHKVEWDRSFAAAHADMEQARTAYQFAVAAGKVLAKTNDLHLWLMAGQKTVAAASRRVDPNCRLATLMRLVPQLMPKNKEVMTGQFDNGIAYVLIRGFTGDVTTMAPGLDALTDAKAVILDVRFNSGGDERLAQNFAGYFVTAPQCYARDIIHKDGTDTQPLDRVLEPNGQRPTFTGKVALLIGPENMSSCESFIEMMKTCPNCTTIGEKTWGSSGRPVPHDLGNGVTVALPSWRDLRLDGTCIEGVGLTPDMPVGDSADGKDDPALQRALTLLGAAN